MKNIIPYSLKTIFTIGLVNILGVGYAQTLNNLTWGIEQYPF
jgi:hypothetical protein